MLFARRRPQGATCFSPQRTRLQVPPNSAIVHDRSRLLVGGEDMRAFVRGLAVGLLPATLAGFGAPAEAAITRIEITSRAPAYGGASFGSVGQYETLRGIAYGEVDPNDPLNEVITDIKLAPRNERGMV